MAPLFGLVASAVLVALALMLAGWRWLRALVWRGVLPGRLGALPVEQVDSTEAPRGWKVASLLAEPAGRQGLLAGVAIGGSYEAEDAAMCVLGHRHDPPGLSCDCGFYAFEDRGQAVDLLGRRLGYEREIVVEALCTVDLSGTVLVCEHGYRAQRQHVLEVGVVPWCASCASRGVLERAAVLGPFAVPHLAPPAFGHGQLAARDVADLAVRARPPWPTLHPLCADCGERSDPGEAPVLTLVEAAGLFGTEVRWLDPDTIPRERVLTAHRPVPRRPF